MIGLFGMLITNKAVFMHVHKLEDGSIVVHAHPYNESDNKTPYKTHHHSKTELLLNGFGQLLPTGWEPDQT